MKIDQSYDDFWRSIGHSTAACALLVALVDFYYMVVTFLVVLFCLKIYEHDYKLPILAEKNNTHTIRHRHQTTSFRLSKEVKDNDKQPSGSQRLRKISSCPNVVTLDALPQSIQRSNKRSRLMTSSK